MSETKIDIDLDPKKVIKSLEEIAEETKNLSSTMNDSLGKDAVKSIDKFEKAAENGTGKIKAFFRNLGNSVREDLKSALDFGRVMSGLKFGQSVSEGIKQVFDMEKAFARLNTRMGLSGAALKDFKRNVGDVVASRGQKLEDVLPGVESIAAKGNIKDTKQLTSIANILAKSKAITGEDTEGIAEEAVDILKSQGSKINSTTIAQVVNAMQGARVAGSFKTAAEAGAAMKDISPFTQQLGISTRGAAGLSAVASRAGDAGQNILKQILERGTQTGGQAQLNAVLGQEIFKNGKLDVGALGKVDVNRFGNKDIMEAASGLTGASGQDLKLFVEAFRDNIGQFKNVINGANETSRQFNDATNNFSSKVDMFKESSINAIRDLGDTLSSAAGNVLSGNFGALKEDAKNLGKGLKDNAGVLLGGAAVTAGIGIFAGGGLKNILGKIGGAAGLKDMGTSLAKAKGLEQAAGVTPVYVVNASEIGSGGGLIDSITKKGGGALSRAGAALGSIGTSAASMGSAGVAALATPIGLAVTGAIAALWPTSAGEGADVIPQGGYSQMGVDPNAVKNAIIEGTVEGNVKAQQASKKDQKVIYTNPSAYPSTGRKM